MNISGVLVHARPGRQAAVEDRLRTLPGVEVHASGPAGRLVVTLEEKAGEVGKTLSEIESLCGVLSAALVYQHSEPDSKLEELYDVDDTA